MYNPFKLPEFVDSESIRKNMLSEALLNQGSCFCAATIVDGTKVLYIPCYILETDADGNSINERGIQIKFPGGKNRRGGADEEAPRWDLTPDETMKAEVLEEVLMRSLAPVDCPLKNAKRVWNSLRLNWGVNIEYTPFFERRFPIEDGREPHTQFFGLLENVPKELLRRGTIEEYTEQKDENDAILVHEEIGPPAFQEAVELYHRMFYTHKLAFVHLIALMAERDKAWRGVAEKLGLKKAT